MIDKKSTIDALFSDSGPFDEGEVVMALHDHVTIQRSTNKIFLKDSSISVDKKILAYGLAKKLLKIKGLIENEFITAQEFHEITGIKKGTVDPTFKILKDKGFLVGKREYEIPTNKVSVIIQKLTSNK
ncbi:MAG: hypothetical protein M1352_03470 [Patescibacteria group bacterium]|nr:hypothetical protein [Patescibacteria group bacterium]